MKTATLIVQCEDGKLHSVADTSVEELLRLAEKVRREKAIEVGKKSLPVIRGMVLASWRMTPVCRFRV